MNRWSLAVAGLLMLAASTLAQAAEKAIIVFDASGSMWGQIGGEAKIAIARQTLATVLGTIPPDLELGFIAYGHRDKGRCDDIELMVPVGPGTAGAIAAAADSLTPKGKTPISDAVRIAAEDLRYTEEKATVILITDGIETCNADPCAAATAMEEAGVDLTVHVVGFGLSDDEGKQVACLAENTGGSYFAAGDAQQLTQALTRTVEATVAPPPSPAPPPPPAEPEPPVAVKVEQNLKVVSRPALGVEPFAEFNGIRYDVYRATPDGRDQNALETGYGQSRSEALFSMPPGRYVVVASKDLARGETTVEVNETSQAIADIVIDAGLINARALATPGSPVANGGGVRWDITDSDGETDTGYGPERTIVVTSGEVTVAATLGAASASVPVSVEAGMPIDVEVVLNSGRLVLRGKRSVEAVDYDNGIRWDVTDGAGKTETAYGGEASFDLPAGDYTVRASLGEAAAEVRIALAAGATLEQEVVVATGKVIARALFAEGGPAVTASPRFDVLAAEPGADGERKTITTAYNDGTTFDLPPGKYVLRATSDVAIAEAGFELIAGPPLEVAVVLNAGLLAVTAPGANRLDILSSKKDIYGKQEILSTRYGEDWSIAVPAGEYVLKATKGDGTESTTPVSIKPGERTEVAVP